MHYIVFDLEFNQDFSSLQNFNSSSSRYPFEITQIGALKLDQDFRTVATFNRYIKPTFYAEVSSFITELTGITTAQLLSEETFPNVFNAFTEFIGKEDVIFCIWGMSDIKELFRNAEYHQLNNASLPRQFINIQPYVSKYFQLSSKQLMSLEAASSSLLIPLTEPFHDASNDAYYTAEIFKKVYNPSIKPSHYDPLYIPIRPKQPKKQIDFYALINQFEKMYDRKMTPEEQTIIKLAYKMGKTGQFLK